MKLKVFLFLALFFSSFSAFSAFYETTQQAWDACQSAKGIYTCTNTSSQVMSGCVSNMYSSYYFGTAEKFTGCMYGLSVPCTSNQTFNHSTGQCENSCDLTTHFIDPITSVCTPNQCPDPAKVRDPVTKACELPPSPESCPSGYYWSVSVKKCVPGCGLSGSETLCTVCASSSGKVLKYCPPLDDCVPADYICTDDSSAPPPPPPVPDWCKSPMTWVDNQCVSGTSTNSSGSDGSSSGSTSTTTANPDGSHTTTTTTTNPDGTTNTTTTSGTGSSNVDVTQLEKNTAAIHDETKLVAGNTDAIAGNTKGILDTITDFFSFGNLDPKADQSVRVTDKLDSEFELSQNSLLSDVNQKLSDANTDLHGYQPDISRFNFMKSIFPEASGCQDYPLPIAVQIVGLSISFDLVLPICVLSRFKNILEWVIYALTAIYCFRVAINSVYPTKFKY